MHLLVVLRDWTYILGPTLLLNLCFFELATCSALVLADVTDCGHIHRIHLLEGAIVNVSSVSQEGNRARHF